MRCPEPASRERASSEAATAARAVDCALLAPRRRRAPARRDTMITRNGHRDVLGVVDKNVPPGADDSDGSEYSYKSDADDSDDGFVVEEAAPRHYSRVAPLPVATSNDLAALWSSHLGAGVCMRTPRDDRSVDDFAIRPFGTVDPEAAAAADAEDVPPDAASVVDFLSKYTLEKLLEPLPQARLVRAAHGQPAYATSLLGLAAAADAFAATRTAPRGGPHGGVWRQGPEPHNFFLFETVANSACSIASAVGYLKHGGEHSSRALCSLVVDAFVNSPMFAGQNIALIVPCPHDDETAAKGYSPYDLAVKVEQDVDGVTVLKGVVHHDEAIGRPESGATPSKRREFYDRRRPTVNVAMLKALRPGTIVGIIDVRTKHYSKIGALVQQLHDIVVNENLQLTVKSFVVSQDISSGSPANDVTPEIFRALDDAARLDLHEHGPASPEGTYFHTSYIVTDAALEPEQLPIAYAGSAGSRTTTPEALSPALLTACKSGTATSIARALEPLLGPRATEHTRGLMQGKKSPAFRVMWRRLRDVHGQNACVSVAMKGHLIVFNKDRQTKEELVRLCGLPNEDALIRVVELLVASARRRPFHLIIDRESSPSTQAASCA